MPLIVQCPRGCQVKMPRGRAGRVVRCPECKCAMRVPKLTEAQLKMGRVIPCRAKFARRRNLDPEEAAHREKESREREAKAAKLKSEGVAQSGIEKTEIETSSDAPAAERDLSQIVPPPAPQLDGLFRVPSPGTAQPPRPKPHSFAASSAVGDDAGPASLISLLDPPSKFEEKKDWEQRLSVANEDRKLFARFFAICLCLVAVLNVIPATLQWHHWSQLADGAPLPRWIYMQLFIGGVYLIYAFFLAQIPDWSALRAVSVAMLVMAFIFGIISTGLLVGGHGSFSGHLGIPFALNREACIWCVAMLCVATLMSFWGGKESANWQRAEQILDNILNKSA